MANASVAIFIICRILHQLNETSQQGIQFFFLHAISILGHPKSNDAQKKPGFVNGGCLPSGKHTKSYWKWPFIVDLPIKNGDCP